MTPSTPHTNPPRRLDHRRQIVLAAMETHRNLPRRAVDQVTYDLSRIEKAQRDGVTPLDVDPYLQQAYDLKQKGDSLLRNALEALLLTNLEAQQVATQLGLPLEVVQRYAEAFFDTSVFPDQAALTTEIIAEFQDVPDAQLVPALFWKIVALREGHEGVNAVMQQQSSALLRQAAQFLAQKGRSIGLHKLARAIETVDIDAPQALRRGLKQLEALDGELADDPQEDLAQRIDELYRAFADILSCGNTLALPAGLQPFADCAAELSYEERLRAACGQELSQAEMIQDLNFPNTATPPTQTNPTNGPAGGDDLAQLKAQVFGPAVARQIHPLWQRRETDGDRIRRRIHWENARYENKLFLTHCEESIRHATDRTPAEQELDKVLLELMAPIRVQNFKKRFYAFEIFMEAYPEYRQPKCYVPTVQNAPAPAAPNRPQRNNRPKVPAEERGREQLDAEDNVLRRYPREAFVKVRATPEEQQLDETLVQILESVPATNPQLRRRKLRVFLHHHQDYKLPDLR